MIDELYDLLRDHEVPCDRQTWNRRYRNFMEKIRTGSLFEVGEVYRDRRVDFYCGCRFDADKQVDAAGCGLQARSDSRRATRIEIEHVFPAAQFGNFRQCWREPREFAECTTAGGRRLGGRECCEKVDPVFRAAHNDLHNLYPVVGEVNGDRQDYNWGMLAGEQRGPPHARRVGAPGRGQRHPGGRGPAAAPPRSPGG